MTQVFPHPDSLPAAPPAPETQPTLKALAETYLGGNLTAMISLLDALDNDVLRAARIERITAQKVSSAEGRPSAPHPHGLPRHHGRIQCHRPGQNPSPWPGQRTPMHHVRPTPDPRPTHAVPVMTPSLRQFMRSARVQGATWWHGNPTSGPIFNDPTPGLEGLWLADRISAALWYATHPATGTGELLAFQATGPFPSLRDPAVLRRLCQLTGLSAWDIRRNHERGTLYLTHQATICRAAKREYPGLLLRDNTQGPHWSLVVWDDTRVRVTGRYRFIPSAQRP